MKTFELKFTQELKGYYTGTMEIQARTRKEAFDNLSKLSNTEIDDLAEWEHGDEYYADNDTIKLIKVIEL
jgi:hypothetical protein